MNTQNVSSAANRIELKDIFDALLGTETLKDSKVVYQWQTPRGAVAMEFDDEPQARKWYTERMKKPNADFMPPLELFKIETTNITTKL